MFWQAIKTIKHMSPVLYLMENVAEIAAGADESDLAMIKTYMDEELGASFSNLTIEGVEPIHSAFPTHKKRVLCLGGRSDQIGPSGLGKTFTMLIENPLPVSHTY